MKYYVYRVKGPDGFYWGIIYQNYKPFKKYLSFDKYTLTWRQAMNYVNRIS